MAATAASPGIVAVVNDEAISALDLNNRTRLALLSAAVPETPESLDFYSKQTLQLMIDEVIQAGAAKKLNVTVGDEEVAAAIQDLEKQNKMPPGGLKKILDSRGVPYATVEQQVRASLLWGRLVRRQYGTRVTISNQDVAETRERLLRRKGQQEFALSEIVLRLDDKDSAANRRARDLADRLYADLRKGADFRALARDFSASSSAAAGGELGWLSADDLGAVRGAAVQAMQPGQITAPFVDEDSVVLLWLKARRTGGDAAVETAPAAALSAASEVLLFQTVFEVPGDVSQKQLTNLRDNALKAARSFKSCSDAEKLAARRKDISSGSLGSLPMAKLPQQVREAVAPLPVGGSTPPLLVNGVIVVFTVCDRIAPAGAAVSQPAPVPVAASIPGDDQIRERLRQQKMERLADSYMKELRRSSFVDLKKP